MVRPANEAQARPLTKLDTPSEQAAAWKEVVDTAPKDDDGEPIITAPCSPSEGARSVVAAA